MTTTAPTSLVGLVEDLAADGVLPEQWRAAFSRGTARRIAFMLRVEPGMRVLEIGTAPVTPPRYWLTSWARAT